MAVTRLLFLFAASLLVQVAYCKRRESFLDDSKIVGGHNTTVSKLPYQVLVVVKDTQGRYLCGGSILNEEYILTAGHCVYLIKNATVRAGITDDTEPEKDNPYIPAKRFAYHPLYDPNNSDYDVGFLQLSQKLNLDGWKRKAVHLVQAGSKVPVGAKVTASGWGTTTENGTLSNILNEVEVNVVSPIECRKVYGKDEITQRMICAGVPEGGKDACQGDSGGPLVYSSTKKQVGIVSIGIGCARPGVPGVYTNLANPGIRSWIKKHTGA
ncbi:trypsin-1-like isoform X4 [Leptidea sinapis]|uniref:trypsin-1-like isoform X4 n=1 Tax=Leptidea sinapis TaxID=189913 RepID=UPI00214592DB|nr:trypsin-1-like isoform X4 [Leptidea sinapis]